MIVTLTVRRFPVGCHLFNREDIGRQT
ncbi:hypothetical protein TB2_025350 [Malus domestica]